MERWSHVAFERTAVCVGGSHIAADIAGNLVVQDDDDNLWVLAPVASIDFAVELEDDD
jgi:hypothetical protein